MTTSSSRSVWLVAAIALIAVAAGSFALGRTTASSTTEAVGVNQDGLYMATAKAWGGDLYTRTFPGRAGWFTGTIQYGDPLLIECSLPGEQVTWNDLSTDVWYRLDGGDRYTTSAYADLAAAGSVPVCEDDPPEAPPEGFRDDAYAELRTNGEDYSLAMAPDNVEEERSLPNRTAVTLLCHAYGDEAAGFFHPSDLWYEVEGGGWVNEGNLITGAGGEPPVEPC